MKKVTGIGGIFFKCEDPKKIREWYKTHLGLDTNDYGANFEWREESDPAKKGSTQWSPFSATTKYFEPSTRDFMINYRVENLEALVEQLKTEGVTIVDKIETYEYGKFVHIVDIEGNKIELWEPAEQYVTSGLQVMATRKSLFRRVDENISFTNYYLPDYFGCSWDSLSFHTHNGKELIACMYHYARLLENMNVGSIAWQYDKDGELGNVAKGRDSIWNFLIRFSAYRILSNNSKTDSVRLSGDPAIQKGI